MCRTQPTPVDHSNHNKTICETNLLSPRLLHLSLFEEVLVHNFHGVELVGGLLFRQPDLDDTEPKGNGQRSSRNDVVTKVRTAVNVSVVMSRRYLDMNQRPCHTRGGLSKMISIFRPDCQRLADVPHVRRGR